MDGKEILMGVKKSIQRKWPFFLVIALLTVSGCATEKTAQKDPFFNKWSTLAETSQGNSPAALTDKDIKAEKITRQAQENSPSQEGTQERLLPEMKISLKMRQADIKAVLRSLARTAGQNLLLKNEIKGDITVDFNNIPWNQAFRSILNNHGLVYVWEGEILRVMNAEDIELEMKRKSQLMGVRWVEPLLSPVVVNIDFADAKKLTENLQDFLTKDKEGKPRGSIKLDEHGNSLIIQAIRDDLDRIMKIINHIDKPTPQIQIKANIVETTKETARNLGIQWGGKYVPRVGDHDLFISPGVNKSSLVPASSLSGNGYGVNFPASSTATATAATLNMMFGTLGGNILEMQLSALQENGKINILSSPSITTLDNQKAYTENGEKVPYVTTENSNGTTTNTVKFEDAVLRLEITPHVIDGRNLKMKIFVKKDEVDTSRTVEGNPFIIKKQTETTLIVQDGETIVISGLTKQRVLDSTSGVPALKDIPALGWIFKNQEKEETMEEVLIFITPTILQMQNVAVLKDSQGQENKSSNK